MKNIIYMYSNLDRNNKLLIIIICVIVALLLLIGIYNVISSFVSKMKLKKRNKALDEEVSKNESEPVKVETKKEEPKPEIKVETKETKEEIIENYQNTVKEEMEEIETLDENVSDIDEILLEMMNIGAQEEFDLTDFEREQEENAIISYGELCKKAGEEKIVYPKKEVNKEIEQKIDKEVYRNNNYKPTTYISPIYGVQKEEKQSNDEESEFLGKLKEFRSGL